MGNFIVVLTENQNVITLPLVANFSAQGYQTSPVSFRFIVSSVYIDGNKVLCNGLNPLELYLQNETLSTDLVQTTDFRDFGEIVTIPFNSLFRLFCCDYPSRLVTAPADTRTPIRLKFELTTQRFAGLVEFFVNGVIQNTFNNLSGASVVIPRLFVPEFDGAEYYWKITDGANVYTSDVFTLNDYDTFIGYNDSTDLAILAITWNLTFTINSARSRDY